MVNFSGVGDDLGQALCGQWTDKAEARNDLLGVWHKPRLFLPNRTSTSTCARLSHLALVKSNSTISTV